MATAKKTAGRKPATAPAAKRRGTEPGKKRGPYKPRAKKDTAAGSNQSVQSLTAPLTQPSPALVGSASLGEIPSQVHDLTMSVGSLETTVDAMKQKLTDVTKDDSDPTRKELSLTCSYSAEYHMSQLKTELGREVEHLAARVRRATLSLLDQINALGL